MAIQKRTDLKLVVDDFNSLLIQKIPIKVTTNAITINNTANPSIPPTYCHTDRIPFPYRTSFAAFKNHVVGT